MSREINSRCHGATYLFDASLDVPGLDIERILNKVMQLILREIDRKELIDEQKTYNVID